MKEFSEFKSLDFLNDFRRSSLSMSPLFSVRARTVDHLLSPVARQPGGIGHHIVTFDIVDL